MAINNVVCRYRDGKMIKGYTQDFSPNKEVFHVHVSDVVREVVEVNVSQLKAIFFVKSLGGRKSYQDKLYVSNPLPGTKIVIEFFDGERISGVTPGFSRNRIGFFITPLDPDSNNERLYVINRAVSKVLVGAKAEEFLGKAKQTEI